MKCGCSWVDDDGDGSSWTCYGVLHYAGKICSQAEWNEKIEKENAEKARREAYAAKEEALNEKYRQKLKRLPTIYKLISTDADKKECLLDVESSDLHFDGNRLSLSSVQEINRSYPCKCNPGCTIPYGGGYILTKDGKRLVLKNWQKEGFWPFQKAVTHYSLWGTLTVRIALANGYIHPECIVIDISRFRSLSIYTPSRLDLIGE